MNDSWLLDLLIFLILGLVVVIVLQGDDPSTKDEHDEHEEGGIG